MKKIFLLLFLLTCLLSFNFANAGVNETGSSSISLECKKTMLKKYQSDLSVSKSEGKNFLMYASVTENDCVWYQTWPKKEVSKKDHKYAFKKCKKEAKKNGLKTDCFIFAVNDKIVWKNFDKQAVLASKDAPLEKKISSPPPLMSSIEITIVLLCKSSPIHRFILLYLILRLPKLNAALASSQPSLSLPL